MLFVCRIRSEVYDATDPPGPSASARSVPPTREVQARSPPRVRERAQIVDRQTDAVWVGIQALAAEQSKFEIARLR